MTHSLPHSNPGTTLNGRIKKMNASLWLVGLALALAQAALAQAYQYPLASQPQPDEMRITFLGTDPLPRESQAANSVFVECGTNDAFVFD